MSREDTMICMDNSEWMRNGDFPPTRFDSQYQAIEEVLRRKMSNVENTVGLLSLAGGAAAGVQVLCSPTTERFKVGKAAAAASIGGKADLLTGLRVAQLALKHRSNRQIQARIVVFIGSPLNDLVSNKTPLQRLAKQLKKSNVAVDVIIMGEVEVNEQLLTDFIKDVEKAGVSSSIIVVPPGTYVEDAIKNSNTMEFGALEEEDDPMLAQALRESLMLAQGNQGNVAGSPTTAATDNISTAATEGQSSVGRTVDEDDDDEDALMKQAKLMSLMETENSSSPPPKPQDSKSSDASSLLNKNYFKNMAEKAGVMDDPEVQKELEDLQKKSKDDDKKDGK